MDYSVFKDLIVAQDKRNVFTKGLKDVKNIPEQIQGFYRSYNPIDIEFSTNDFISLILYPFDSLGELQDDFSYLGNIFVFATSNGDPIFLNDGAIYVCAHGCDDPPFEFVANSFNEFIELLVKGLK